MSGLGLVWIARPEPRVARLHCRIALLLDVFAGDMGIVRTRIPAATDKACASDQAHSDEN
jgi:hypothetical protein